eukprot:1825077-Rhodomonas_salina.2
MVYHTSIRYKMLSTNRAMLYHTATACARAMQCPVLRSGMEQPGHALAGEPAMDSHVSSAISYAHAT